ncbi:MAG TPA: 4-hydroxythreonine-4-phosphate dehydrogenase PdxA [Thiotrichales bacterium]|nr:4-hydroxythreonine-4-phosphate dehydrogenase PdxA [Thiotrichales bacterium]
MIRLAITSGEPAGIGPELMARIRAGDFYARLVILGDRSLIEQRARDTGHSIALTEYQPERATAPGLEILHLPLRAPATAGQLDAANAPYVLDQLNRACDGCLAGEFGAMVTAPIQKEIINASGLPFSGHTEYLAERCGGQQPVMMLATEGLRVALATTHLPLREVADAITEERLESILRILDRDLRERFGLPRPHIKVCGLNPHAGENGYLGREEIDLIIPLLGRLQDQGLNLSGPWPADTLFTPDGLADADAVLAMYHDQGLPVLKHAGFHRAINTTLGLPIIRTSVDHGTALALAGSGKADPNSLFEAIHSAIEQARHQGKVVSA